MNISSVIRFIVRTDNELSDTSSSKIVYCIESSKRLLTNAVFLMGSCYVIKRDRHPDEVWSLFEDLRLFMTPYRDATYAPSDFDLEVLDCWKALRAAKRLRWILPTTNGAKWGEVDLAEYEFYESPENGDAVQVVPGEFVAFKGPRDLHDGAVGTYEDAGGFREFSPQHYLEVFRKWNVTTVIRLNSPA
jgi:hypothetical protein